MSKQLKACSCGHQFQKSSNCPICPKCWPGFYKKLKTNLPKDISAPALRALLNAKITNLSELAKYSETEILELHGMGLGSVTKLRAALKTLELSFKKESENSNKPTKRKAIKVTRFK